MELQPVADALFDLRLQGVVVHMFEGLNDGLIGRDAEVRVQLLTGLSPAGQAVVNVVTRMLMNGERPDMSDSRQHVPTQFLLHGEVI